MDFPCPACGGLGIVDIVLSDEATESKICGACGGSRHGHGGSG